jgi:phosphate transport system substrate-binding protein
MSAPLIRLGAIALGFALPLSAQEKQGAQDATAKGAASQVDARLPDYKPSTGVSGNLKSVGSDSMDKLMEQWCESFHKLYPSVVTEIEAKGSNTAPPALIAGTAHLAPMSRPMKKSEEDDFEKAFGYKPTDIYTSIDMLAVYVHKDNPIKSLTLQQVDAIFSSTRKGGYDKDIKTWGDLGLTGDWQDKPISLFGRNSASGTYSFFKDKVLKNGDYKNTVKEQVGSSSVVQGVATDKYAMGYSGIGYKTADVRAVPLQADAKAKVIEASSEHAYDGEYPLWRFLLIYVNKKKGENLDPLRGEFLRYVLSKQGQLDVVKENYLPLPARVAQEQRTKLGL